MRHLAILLTATLVAAPATAAPEPAVRRTPVEFRVVNVNRSPLPCAADGLRHVVRGELLHAPGTDTSVATVALHEFSFGRFFWSPPGHPSYDLAAAMARAGHPWFIVDRLGYDDSDHPRGGDSCLGAQADVAAQIVRAVSTGDYRLGDDTRGPAFRQVALVGHSVGAGVAELAAHGFPDLPLAGLAVLGWADQGYSVSALQQSVQQGSDCAQGGEPAEPGAPSGYAWFGRTPERFRQNMFFDAEPALVATVTALRNRDPCGDNASLARLAVVNRARIGDIRVPVLLAFGDRDPVFMTDAPRRQARAFSGSAAVTLHTAPRAAHALTLERSHQGVRARLLDWLTSLRDVAARRTVNR